MSVSSLFCRHNRFTADCPICSKGTVLDANRAAGRRPRPKPAGPRGAGRRGGAGAGGAFSGPYVTAGPYEREDGGRYEVRLERVPGGVRLAEWSGGRLEKRAPELPAADLAGLVAAAAERELLPGRDIEALVGAMRAEPVGARGDLSTADADPAGPTASGAGSTDLRATAPRAGSTDAVAASPGRAGDLREELRVDRRDGDRVRVGRWLFYPSRGWELQDAPPMLAAARYAEALRGAARLGLLRTELSAHPPAAGAP